MPSIWKTLAAVGTIAFALTIWGCEQVTDVADQRPQVEVEAREGLIADGIGDLAGLNSVESTTETTLESVTATVGPLGGVLELAGHVLTIPAGAVSEPTTFTMTTIPNGGVEVELQATSLSSLAELNDVGSEGFDQPVRLALSYADTNAGDPEDLVIVRVDDGEPQETHVSTDGTSTVWADLDHFSRYRLCSN